MAKIEIKKILIFIILTFSSFVSNATERDWLTSAGNYKSHRFFLGQQIVKDNIKELEKFWIFNSSFSSPIDTVQAPPLFIKDQLIVVTLSGDLISISPDNGSVNWKVKLENPIGRRGLTYYMAENKNLEGLYVASKDKIIHLDKYGKIKNTFLTGLSLLHPIVYEDTLYVATLTNGIKAYDLLTKKEIWQTSLNKNNINSRVWSGFSFDFESKTLFVVTSNPAKDHKTLLGKNRNGDDYSVSLIALSASDGSIKWQYKHINNDLWDFDLVGNPIIVKNIKIKNQNQSKNSVIALSKTGDVIMVEIETGQPIFKDSFKNISVERSDIKDVFTSPTQKSYSKPEKFSNIIIDTEKDFGHLDNENLNFIKNKIRHAKSGFYVPTSLNHDVIIYGLHGGAEWPGGTLIKSENSTNLIIPSNNYPWIIRVHYQEKKYLELSNFFNGFPKKIYYSFLSLKNNLSLKINKIKNIFSSKKESKKIHSVDLAFKNRTEINKFFEPPNAKYKLVDKIYKFLPGSFNNKTYATNCAGCHGNARQGRMQSEVYGDAFYPSLVGMTETKKWNLSDTYEKMKKYHESFNIKMNLSLVEFKSMTDYFKKYDKKLISENHVELSAFWQLLLDKDGLPATTPPWGKITNLNLSTGKKIWEVPFGIRKVNNKIIKGDINFGGVLSTKNNIAFFTGGTDSMAYALDVKTGKVIWSDLLPYAGSAPPMAFNYKGCDFIVFTSTGGRFVGYKKNGDATVAYKLKSCTITN